MRLEELSDRFCREAMLFGRLLHPDARFAGRGEQENAAGGDRRVGAQDGQQCRFSSSGGADEHRQSTSAGSERGGLFSRALSSNSSSSFVLSCVRCSSRRDLQSESTAKRLPFRRFSITSRITSPVSTSRCNCSAGEPSASAISAIVSGKMSLATLRRSPSTSPGGAQVCSADFQHDLALGHERASIRRGVLKDD